MSLLVLPMLIALGAPPTGERPGAEPLRFFETQVRPIIVQHCQKCHGAEKQWAGLRLDSRAALITGGDSGPAVIPGESDNSLLIKAVRQQDEALSMPPDDKLSDAQIADLAKWIEMGAPYPSAEKATPLPRRDPNHWAFQPPAKVPLPANKATTWPKTDLDHFVLAKLEAAGLAPAPMADKRTLIRRVTFDLTGLPPTPAEIDAFLADAAPDAFSRLVDRLLESPAYGEHWGRHWLDVARYADSNGLDENVAHGNAWRYRDYVIASLNQDKPYDRFLVEQLAGDLLPSTSDAQRHEQLIATGFLALGAKVLAEVDQDKMQMDIVDEQIDTVGRVFLGLTLGCARCHDHKFDPISTADYYGLAGVFKSTRTMESLKSVARWHEHPLLSPADKIAQGEYDARIAALQKEIDTLVAQANQAVQQAAAAADNPVADLEAKFPQQTKDKLKTLRDNLAEQKKNAPIMPAAMGVTEDRTVDVPVHIRGSAQKLGAVVARCVLPVMRGVAAPTFPAQQSGRYELAQWLVDPQHPLTSRVIVNRAWRWHFGTGIVPTPDNFGSQGELATHPELLDWLAQWFVDHQWSLKELHRLILNSNTYQQSSIASAQAYTQDPENHLYSRTSKRRLNAEELRDALLMVGGTLDRTMGGSLLKVKNREYIFDHTSQDTTDYSARRRSMYLPVIRNNPYDALQLYDFPDAATSNGNRATTTTAPQALMMLNSDLILQAADDLAARLEAQANSHEERLRLLYQLTYARDITPAELADHLAFLDRVANSIKASPETAADSKQAWSILCQTILAAHEFIYVN